MNRINPHRKFVGIFIPNCLVESKIISAGAKITYGRLAQYAGRDGFCFPKQNTLAEALGVSKPTILKYLVELENVALVEVTKPKGVDRRNNRSCVYFFLDHPLFHEGDSELDNIDASALADEELESGSKPVLTSGSKPILTSGSKPVLTSGSKQGLTSLKETHIEETHIEEKEASVVASPLESKKSSSNGKDKRVKVDPDEALKSYPVYREYMLLEETLEKNISDWTSRDFVIFYFCGIAHSQDTTSVLSFPVWGKDCKLMGRYMKKYGNKILYRLLKTIFLHTDKISEKINRPIKPSMAVIGTQWIMDIVEQIFEDITEQERLHNLRNSDTAKKAHELMSKRTEEYRKKVRNKNN